MILPPFVSFFLSTGKGLDVPELPRLGERGECDATQTTPMGLQPSCICHVIWLIRRSLASRTESRKEIGPSHHQEERSKEARKANAPPISVSRPRPPSLTATPSTVAARHHAEDF